MSALSMSALSMSALEGEADITEPQSDALDGSILMARRAFFRLDLVRLRAG